MKQPLTVFTLDMETAYGPQYSLSKMTTQEYIDDPRFEVILTSVKKNDEPAEWFSGSYEETKHWLYQFPWEQSIAVFHHANFDASILAWRFGIRPKLVACTLSMGRALHGTSVGGSLKVLAEHYGIGQKGDEVLHAIGKWRKDFTPEELERYAEYCKLDVDLTYELFKCMAPKFNAVEMHLISMTVKMHSEPMLQLDRRVLEQHLQDVQDNKERLLTESGLASEDLRSDQRLAEVLKGMGVEPPTKVSARTGKEAYAFAKSDEAFKKMLEHDDPRVQAIVAARLGVKTTIEESRTERFIAIHDAGGALPVPLQYYKAMTGRWAGSEKINLQSLPRTSALKKAIVAPLGHVIVGADLSNIELRVGLAFAGQEDKLKMLGEGLDLYKDFVAPIFNVAYDEVNDGQRFIGKTSQLSLIYGTGAKKLRAAIKADPRYGTDIGEELAQSIVNTYRSEYSNVKAAWYNAGRALEAVWLDTEDEIALGPLKLRVRGSQGIELPSGLFMQYPQLDKTTNAEGREQWTYKQRKGRSWETVYIHPAKCYQNTIQALARCIMGEAMVRINKRYRVGLTIHDACYTVVPVDEAEEALKFIIRELKKPPIWMPDIPLDAEGGIGENLAFKMGKVKV